MKNTGIAKLCTWCLGAVSGKRRSWCGEECLDEFFVRWDWQAVRGKVFARDKGVCAACGRDTLRAQRIHGSVTNHAWSRVRLGHLPSRYRLPPELNERVARWNGVARLIAQAYGLVGLTNRDWWEADHIQERVRGGLNEMQNLQTLCLRCHKRKTARLARERADERRGRIALITVEVMGAGAAPPRTAPRRGSCKEDRAPLPASDQEAEEQILLACGFEPPSARS